MTDFPAFLLDTNTHVATVASLTDWRAYVRTFAEGHMPPMSPSEARSFLLRTCRMVSLSNPGRNTNPPTAGTRIEHSGQLLVEWAAERGVDLALAIYGEPTREERACDVTGCRLPVIGSVRYRFGDGDVRTVNACTFHRAEAIASGRVVDLPVAAPFDELAYLRAKLEETTATALRLEAEVARLTAERQALTAERAELLLRVDRLEAEARATAARDEMAAEHTRQLGEAIGEPALSWGAAIDRARLLWEFVRLDERHADKAHALLNAGAWAVGLDLPGRVQAVLDRVRTLEEQLAGAREQAEEARAELARVRAERPRPLTPAAIERAHAALVRVRDAERELAELGVVAHG